MLRIAHRGASGYEPENTLRSFSKALELGVDMIEFDVRICKGGDLVVFHDESLDRITNGQGHISNLALEDLKKYDVGKGERIPTLSEVLDLIDRRVPVNIELKSKGTAEPAAIIIGDYIKSKGWSPELFWVSSFDRKELARFVKINPGAKLGILARKNPFGVITRAKYYKAHFICIPKPYLKRWWVKTAQKNGFRVFVFTLNSTEEIEQARLAGVDGIFSNYPDRI
ncbi:MAG: glycerophosphodiester phosphodiesterase family protein [Candidatus Colwellbacteria bacterium]|nr:glycerophosphodiester phosphodiesterase family protein [Candidatus Colwellbacteria bacterium]